MEKQYSNVFLKDIDPIMGEHYMKWFPFFSEAVAGLIENMKTPKHLKNFLNVEDDAYIQTVIDNWVVLLDSYLKRSGKMLRPYIVCFCLDAYGKEPNDWKEFVALAEFVHSTSLILDDIVDDSLFRRGAPTAHQMHGNRIAGEGAIAWLNFGAKLAWDNRDRLSSRQLRELLNALNWEHFVTGVGTTFDVTWAWLKKGDFSPETYLQQVIHRSTSYTYRLHYKIGTILADAPEKDKQILSQFGEYIGMAFQLIDDKLNVASEDSHWGKELCEDIAQGKYTMQVILALKLAEEKDRKLLLEVLGSKSHDYNYLAQALDVLKKSGAIDASMDYAKKYLNLAQQEVEQLSVSQENILRLQAFASYVFNRTR